MVEEKIMVLPRYKNRIKKLQMTVELIDLNGVRLRLVDVDFNALQSKHEITDNKIYLDTENRFSVWSYNDLYLDENQLRLPSISTLNSTKQNICAKFFKNEHTRKEALRRMYIALNKWSKCKNIFPDIYSRRNNNIIMSGIYWTIH